MKNDTYTVDPQGTSWDDNTSPIDLELDAVFTQYRHEEVST